jgi:hypothetical protein
MSVAPVATKTRVAAPRPSIRLRRLRQAVAHPRAIERRDQTPQLRGIEAGIDLDPKPRSEQDPKLSMPLRASRRLRTHARSAILNDLDGNNLLPVSTLCNAPAPRIQRMHAQPMRRAKLLAPQTALLELRYQAIRLRPAPPTKHRIHSVCLHASTSTQTKSQTKNGVARMHTIEECFGWLKDIALLRKLKHRGLFKVGWIFTFAAAAYNLVRMRKLIPIPTPA